MELSKDQVKAIARLAAIKLNEAEIIRFQGELSHILDHLDQLKELDVAGVEPTHQVTGLVQVTRPDVVAPPADRERILDAFPERQDDYLKLPNKK